MYAVYAFICFTKVTLYFIEVNGIMGEGRLEMGDSQILYASPENKRPRILW